MNDLGILEINGRRKWFSENWDPDTFNFKPSKEIFSMAMCEKAELLLLAELDGNHKLVNQAYNFIIRARDNMLNRPEPTDYRTSLDLLLTSLFFGNDTDFQMFVDEMQIMESYEKKYLSQENYVYYKCLCAIWKSDFPKAREILNNNEHAKGKGKFNLPSSSNALRALLDDDKELFLQWIDKMRAEHARKHKNVNMVLQSYVRRVVDMATLALLKVAEKKFIDVTKKLPERIDTFKFIPRFIDDIDLKERGIWSVDHLFPIKYWSMDYFKLEESTLD